MLELYDTEESIVEDKPSESRLRENQEALPNIGHRMWDIEDNDEPQYYTVFDVGHATYGNIIPTVKAKNKNLVDKLD